VNPKFQLIRAYLFFVGKNVWANMGEDQPGGQDKEHMFKDSESMVKVCYHKQHKHERGTKKLWNKSSTKQNLT
jgi:hypothetical protein